MNSPKLWWLLLALMATPLSVVRLSAQAPAPAATGPGFALIDVLEQSVTPHFPERVDFTLKTRGFLAARAELNYRLVGEAITAGLAAPIDSPTQSVDTSATLDLRTDYIPPGSEVSYYWRLIAPDGAAVETPTKTFRLVDEGYSWRTLNDSRERVRVHWYSGGNSFGQDILDTATRSLDRLEKQIGATLDRRAEIWIYANSDDLFDALPLHQPEWVGGQAYTDLAIVMAAISDDRTARPEIQRIIPHEISHLVLYQATRNPYNVPPAWLDEGLAVNNQEISDPGEEEALREAAETGALLPLRALSGSFGADEEGAILSYAQSGSVIEFILNEPRFGAERLTRTVAAFKDGVTYDEALQAGLGITTDELDKKWRDWLPYEVKEPGSVPRAPRSPSPSPASWVLALIWVGAVIVGGLFIAGGLVTALLLARRRKRA